MKRDDLVKWLDSYLDIHSYKDISLNGLQVEGSAEVEKIAIAVDSSLTTFEQAADMGADMLIVHHGLFWGKPLAISGMHGNRVKDLIKKDLSLYAAHIPLDAHKEVGNNWGLANSLGLADLEDFGDWQGKPIGVKGIFPNPVTLRELADSIENTIGDFAGSGHRESVLVHAGGNMEVSSMGIISGGASWDVVTAAEQDLDVFLTGEPKHETFYETFERGINAIYAGHYMTETVGVNLLAKKLQEEFNLPYEFILLSTQL